MEYNNAGKKGLRDGKERILDVTAAAASAAAENLPRRVFEGEARTQAPGGDAASGIDVINKSVNGVSGLMSVVTRWSGVDGAVEQRQPTSYPSISRSLPPPLSVQSFSVAPSSIPPSFD